MLNKVKEKISKIFNDFKKHLSKFKKYPLEQAKDLAKRIDHRMILGFFIIFAISLIFNGVLANYNLDDKAAAKIANLGKVKSEAVGLTPVMTSAEQVAPASKVEEIKKDEEKTAPVVNPVSENKSKPVPVPVKKSEPTPAPQPKPAPDPVSAPQSTPTPITNSMIDMVNAVRKANGLSLVKGSSLLNQAALAKSKDMATRNYFSHTNPDGNNDFYFIKQVGYKYSAAASNIAQGNFGSEKGLFDAWMKSSGHRANILNASVTEIGYAGHGGYYTMLLAKPL